MAYLKVPARLLLPFKKFLTLPADAITALEAALTKSPPTLKIRDLADEMAKSVTQLRNDEIYEVLSLLAGLTIERSRQEKDLPSFLKEVHAAAEKEADLKSLLADGWPRVEQPLTRILSLEKTFGITAKARDVMTDHQRLLCDARILTDVRPIFLQEVGGSPTAAVVVHTLKITYHVGSKLDEFFVAMDQKDLSELKKILERAEQKQEALLKVWPDSIPMLRGVSHDRGH